MTIYGASFAAEKQTYTWSVVPQFTGTVVHRDWTPLLNVLEKKTGYEFKLKIYDSIPDFEEGFMDGKPDFAYMNPYHAVRAKKEQGYMPIIRDSTKKLTGILVIRKDSDIKSVADLNKKRISFPSPNAFAASLYMRALLTEKEKIEFTPVYSNTHSNSFRQVMLGFTDASGGVFRTLRRERPEIQQQLKVLYKGPSTASHPIVVHERVPKEVADAVQAAILELAKDSTYKEMLKAILIPLPVKADYDQDYQELETLNLDKYAK